MAREPSTRVPGNDASVKEPHPLRRLFRYANPYRGRLAWAVAGMAVYAAWTFLLNYKGPPAPTQDAPPDNKE